jgi:hypothetical protein
MKPRYSSVVCIESFIIIHLGLRPFIFTNVLPTSTLFTSICRPSQLCAGIVQNRRLAEEGLHTKMLVLLNSFRRLSSPWADSRFVRTRSGSSLVTVPRSRRSFPPCRTNRSDGGCHHRRLDNACVETSASASNPSRQQRGRECQFEYYPIPRISRLNWISICSSTQLVHGRNSLVATQPA